MQIVTLKKFVENTELAVWGTLIKAEVTTKGDLLTFKVDQTLKGPVLKTITIKTDTRYNAISARLHSWMFLALRKNAEGEWEQVMMRGAWLVDYIVKKDLSGFYALLIPDGLIQGFPVELKEKTEISHLLPNGERVTLNMKYYDYYKMLKYLKTVFK